MLGILDCIATRHDPWLVMGAVLICAISTFTAFRLFELARRTGPRFRNLCLAMTAVVAGAGVWATHFIAMLAYSPDLPIHFEVDRTIVSLALAVVGVWAGVAIAASQTYRRGAALGGAAMGVGISAMHYAGLTAVTTNFDLQWSPSYILWSIVIAVAGCAAAFTTARRAKGIVQLVAPPALLAVAICGLHFTSMSGLTLIPSMIGNGEIDVFSRDGMAMVVGFITTLLLMAGASVVTIEAQARKIGMRRIETSFHQVPIGLALFDQNACLITWNPAYENIVRRYGVTPATGVALTNMVRQAAASGRFPGAIGRENEWAADFLANAVTTPGSKWRFPDDRWLRMDLCPLAEGGWLSMLNDVTDQKAAAAELTEARDRAEAANHAKSEFLTNMSHELRTPLNGILGMAQVMLAGDLSEVQANRLDIMRESGESLLAILNDVLDLSKIHSGQLSLSITNVDVGELVRSCCAVFEGSAVAKDLSLRCTIDAAAAGLWKVDGLRLRQVLSNLISNSLKFTKDGFIRVRLYLDEADLVLAVQDSGIGMQRDQIPHLFEKFTQADASTTRRYGGAGLGLPICLDLVNLMGGGIEATSVPGEGSCFTIRMRPERGETPALCDAAPATSNETEHAKLRILAAEDNPTNQFVLRSLLAPLGAEIVMVENGLQAVEAVTKTHFDLVLMDIQMPKMSGVDATVAIRGWEVENDADPLPILAVSANIMPHQIEQYRVAGMNGWVAKPIDTAKLFEAIDAALSRRPAIAQRNAA